MAASAAKYTGGSGTKPSRPPNGVNGRAIATAITDSDVTVSQRAGRLRHGLRWVRMTKITRTWVASDSTNHPVWNSGSDAPEHVLHQEEREEVEDRAHRVRSSA